MFEPRLALASLSGEADAAWAQAGAPWAGCAFLGGVSLDARTRAAARGLVARDRAEFLPDDAVAFITEQLAALATTPVRAGVNVRTTTVEPLRAAATVAARHDAILEVNAHCRQPELCEVGAGEKLLCDTERLCEFVGVAAETGADVSVKLRAEVPGVDLAGLASALETAGADCLHIDAMDSEAVVAEVREACDCFLIANNGVRGPATVREYCEYGADAVSVGRPSNDPRVLRRVADALASGREVRP